MGKLDEEIKCYEKSLSIKNDFAGAWMKIGVAYLEANRFSDAIPALQRATEIEPRFWVHWALLSDAYKGIGNSILANQAQARARLLQP
jgi:predicted Zn-dependent protease